MFQGLGKKFSKGKNLAHQENMRLPIIFEGFYSMKIEDPLLPDGVWHLVECRVDGCSFVLKTYQGNFLGLGKTLKEAIFSAHSKWLDNYALDLRNQENFHQNIDPKNGSQNEKTHKYYKYLSKINSVLRKNQIPLLLELGEK